MERLLRAAFSCDWSGRSGIRLDNSLVALDSNWPPTENRAAVCTPFSSRRRNRAERREVSWMSDSSLAMLRPLSTTSASSESSAERPRWRPDSRAFSTRTSNQLSMERVTN